MNCPNGGGGKEGGKGSVFLLQQIYKYMSPVSILCPADFRHLKYI